MSENLRLEVEPQPAITLRSRRGPSSPAEIPSETRDVSLEQRDADEQPAGLPPTDPAEPQGGSSRRERRRTRQRRQRGREEKVEHSTQRPIVARGTDRDHLEAETLPPGTSTSTGSTLLSPGTHEALLYSFDDVGTDQPGANQADTDRNELRHTVTQPPPSEKDEARGGTTIRSKAVSPRSPSSTEISAIAGSDAEAVREDRRGQSDSNRYPDRLLGHDPLREDVETIPAPAWLDELDDSDQGSR